MKPTLLLLRQIYAWGLQVVWEASLKHFLGKSDTNSMAASSYSDYV